MSKRTVEIFSAGGACCEEAIKLISSLACPSCDVQVQDVRSDPQAQAKAKQYGVQRVPAVVVNGQVAECCAQGIDLSTLHGLGLGQS